MCAGITAYLVRGCTTSLSHCVVLRVCMVLDVARMCSIRKLTLHVSTAERLLPYGAYILRVFNFANLEPFAKLIQRKFWTVRENFDTWITSVLSYTTSRWLYSSTLRRWMETIRGPSCLIHAERSWKKYPRLRYPQLVFSSTPARARKMWVWHIWRANSRNYFNKIFKNSYSRKFWPAKYKCYTVYDAEGSV